MTGPERLTPEGARTVRLPLNPIMRVVQVRRIVSEDILPDRQTGIGPITRHGLVKYAEARELGHQKFECLMDLGRQFKADGISPADVDPSIIQGIIHSDRSTLEQFKQGITHGEDI